VIAVITDERFAFVSGTDAAAGDAAEAGSLSYDSLAAGEVDGGDLVVSTVEGTVWRFPLADTPDEVAGAVGRHVAWIGAVRGAVLACRNDVELAAGEIEAAAASRDWEAADSTYRRARATLDDVIDRVLQTTPIEPAVLAPELTSMARELEHAYASLLLDRADSRLGLGEQLVHSGDHDQAASVLGSAQAAFQAAEHHAEAVRRGDDFVFGEQRALEDRLERLEWEIEAVAAEPLRQAHEAKIRARSTNDPDATVTHWEAAFRRYVTVLRLASDDGQRHFAGDVEEIREDLGKTAGQLIAVHQTLARTEWDKGVTAHREGDTIDTILRLAVAIDHLERAHEVASEFRPSAATEMATRLERMRSGLRRVREADAANRSQESGDTPGVNAMGASADQQPGDDTSGDDPTHITASELADIDTHHEITFSDEAMAGDSTDPMPESDDWELLVRHDDEE
jgi:tetratricopeptide (TPR) repeat protein